jgi:hypothetical protein
VTGSSALVLSGGTTTVSSTSGLLTLESASTAEVILTYGTGMIAQDSDSYETLKLTGGNTDAVTSIRATAFYLFDGSASAASMPDASDGSLVLKITDGDGVVLTDDAVSVTGSSALVLSGGTTTVSSTSGLLTLEGASILLKTGATAQMTLTPTTVTIESVAFTSGDITDVTSISTGSATGESKLSGVTMTNGALAGVTTIAASDDITLSKAAAAITHTGATGLTISANGKTEFRINNIKVMEIREDTFETFVPATINGFDLQVSDRRIKRNITDASNSNSLEIFRKLRLREYYLHDTYAASSQNQNEKAAKGFIAQEVAEILPHVVKQLDRTFEAPGYDDLVIKKMNHVQYDYIYLEMVGAVKELIDEKDQMDEDLKTLRAEVQTLKDEKEEAVTGGTGSITYTFGDVVKILKEYGLLET